MLIIEDDLAMQRLVTDALGGEYEVKSVSDGNAAIAEANIFQPDVIMLDVNLPGTMEGLEILDLIRADDFTNTIPVLVYTNSDTDLEQQFLDHGATGYFMKAGTDIATIASEIKKYADMPLSPALEKTEEGLEN